MAESMHEQLEEDQNSWYFFTPRERKYGNGRRPQRSAGNGYWKAVGKDTQIIHNGVVIGYKRVLDFLTGKYPKGERTEWKMHEYLTKDQKDQLHNLPSTSAKLNDCVLCKIYKNERVVNKRKRDGDQVVEEYEASDDHQNIADQSENIVLPTNQDEENDQTAQSSMLRSNHGRLEMAPSLHLLCQRRAATSSTNEPGSCSPPPPTVM
ncbi:hypothetical protein DH2020_024617 [Rehmannia glutinosa]|uniref:NAC domain-containing protein n=1 Tax=Rehmannia glutinosa TaxID=99300 RepID=A0ABR0W5P0_REHGL